MSEMAKKARAAMKEKAQGRAAPNKGSIDASGWTEPTMNTTAKVGMRPLSRRAFKKGGKVDGEKGVKHAGKAPRKGKYYGGEMGTPDMTASDAARMAADAKMRDIIKADAEANAPVPRPRLNRAANAPVPMPRLERGPAGYPRSWENRGGRTKRKDGGKAPITPNSLINRNAKEANEERGYPHTGGYKKGGRTKKEGGGAMDYLSPVAMAAKNPKMLSPMAMAMGKKKGGAVHEDEAMDKKLIKAEMAKHDKGCRCAKCWGGSMKKADGGGASGNYEGGTRPTGGRMARKSGGRAKGKTNIHINIVAGEKHPEGMAPPMGLPGPLPRPPMPVAPPPMAGGAGMPPMGPPPAPMGGGLPPGLGVPPPAMGPMARKEGGRVGHRGYSSYKDMDAGSGSGLGRLEKTEIQKKKG